MTITATYSTLTWLNTKDRPKRAWLSGKCKNGSENRPSATYKSELQSTIEYSKY